MIFIFNFISVIIFFEFYLTTSLFFILYFFCISLYHQVSQLFRQQIELKGAIARDEIFKSNNSSNFPSFPNPRLTFRHIEIFQTALLFDLFVKEMITKTESTILNEMRKEEDGRIKKDDVYTSTESESEQTNNLDIMELGPSILLNITSAEIRC